MWLEIVLCVVLLTLVYSFDWYFHLNVIAMGAIGLLRPPKRITDTYSITRISSTFNTDLKFDHLNNAKYLMYMDFAKTYFWSRNRLLNFMRKVKACPLQSATIIRYMRPCPIFNRVRIDTKVSRVSVFLNHGIN